MSLFKKKEEVSPKTTEMLNKISEFEEEAPSVSEKEISKFEKKIKHKLPEDYKLFILKNNGGMPEQDWCFKFNDVAGGEENSSCIQAFYSLLDDEDEDYNILSESEFMWEEEEISKDFLPIAEDPAGNTVCLSLGEKDYGAVYFCDHEFEDDETHYIASSKLADTFTDFLDALFLDDEN